MEYGGKLLKYGDGIGPRVAIVKVELEGHPVIVVILAAAVVILFVVSLLGSFATSQRRRL
jgi:hypothetical protein